MNCVFTQVRTVTSHFPPWHLVWVTAMSLWNNYYLIWTLAQKIVIPFYWRDWSVKFSYSPKLTQKAVAISGYNSISRFQVWAVSIQQKFPVESSRKAGGNGTEEKEVPQLQKWQTQSEKQSLWSSFLWPTCSLERAMLHLHLPLWPSLNGLKVLHLLIQAHYTRVPDELKSPWIHFPSYASWYMANEDHLPNLSRNFLWASNGSLYSPGLSLNWKFLESRSCLTVLCTLTEDSHSGSSTWFMILAERP